MLVSFHFFSICTGVLSYSKTQYMPHYNIPYYYTKVGPKYLPTKGEAWPSPQRENKSVVDYFVYHSSKFDVAVIYNSCDLLIRAINRYKKILSDMELILSFKFLRKESKSNILIRKLKIILTSECEEIPHYKMNEKYKLTVGKTSLLKSTSIWGILRGLETFSQLFYITDDYSEIRINATNIVDFPRYKHRGLLIDTGRHYLSLSNIYKTIDALAMNKMNVLHWHLVDDQSFPYQSELYPTLSEKGAFYPTMVYTKSDMLDVVEYARDRGVRVMPEIDVPGHTLSMGEAFPSLLTECYYKKKIVAHGPLDPSKNETYEFLKQLFNEVLQWFPDEFIHIGADEVEANCWQSNPNIMKFMKKNNLSNTNNLQRYFIQRVIELLPNQTRPMVWQDVFDINAMPKQKIHVQVWKWNWTREMDKILNAGHYVIFSSNWYLDYNNHKWEDYYRDDPRQMVYFKSNRIKLLRNIVGGEACLWGEMANDNNLHSKYIENDQNTLKKYLQINAGIEPANSRVAGRPSPTAPQRIWPRTSAIAERLWTGLSFNNVYPVNDKVRSRIEEHTCRMRRRGIPSGPPNGPSYCVGAPPKA